MWVLLAVISIGQNRELDSRHPDPLDPKMEPTPRSKVPRPMTCSVARLTESHTLTWGCRGCVEKQRDKQVTSRESTAGRRRALLSRCRLNYKLQSKMQDDLCW